MNGIYTALHQVITGLEAFWETRPHCVLACAFGSDEHWQFFHPEDPYYPVYVLDPVTLQTEFHPDGKPEYRVFG